MFGSQFILDFPTLCTILRSSPLSFLSFLLCINHRRPHPMAVPPLLTGHCLKVKHFINLSTWHFFFYCLTYCLRHCLFVNIWFPHAVFLLCVGDFLILNAHRPILSVQYLAYSSLLCIVYSCYRNFPTTLAIQGE